MCLRPYGLDGRMPPPPPPPPPPHTRREEYLDAALSDYSDDEGLENDFRHDRYRVMNSSVPKQNLEESPVYIVDGQERPLPNETLSEHGLIDYKVVYRRVDSGNVAYSVTSKEPISPPQEVMKDCKAVFEVVTEYPTLRKNSESVLDSFGLGDPDYSGLPPLPPPGSKRFGKSSAGPSADTNDSSTNKPPPVLQISSMKGKTHLIVFSRSVIKALQSVVQYYPAQKLFGETVTIREPFAVLAHHWDELNQYREERGPEVPAHLICERERNTFDHLGALLDYYEYTDLPAVEDEMARHTRGKVSWSMLWLLFKPGTDVVAKDISGSVTRKRGECHYARGFTVQSMDGGPSGNQRLPYQLAVRCLEYDGSSIGWVEKSFFFPPFDGEMNISDLDVVPADWPEIDIDGDSTPVVKHLQSRGRVFFDSIKPCCKQYTGEKLRFPYDPIDELVMIDIKAYYKNYRRRQPLLVRKTTGKTSVFSPCNCDACWITRKDKGMQKPDKFEGYNDIDPAKVSSLTDHQYFLCPNQVCGYRFKTRTWEPLAVENLSEPRFKHDMIDTLVMDPDRIKMLKALSKNFTRHDASLQKQVWSADFVEGKGSSLVFLLHGRPGVGKTYTAECIAEHTRRPLMTLTCADIGTRPHAVERNLARHFSRAQAWGAILLIDEADVFMEKRSSFDLHRNSLVANFLRALEAFSGILFLTTNRVGAFDDAFVSRVHVTLYYPPLQDKDRTRLWKSFINKLHEERGSSMRVTDSATECIESSQVRALGLNGREIRNAFQTAVALAEFEAHKSEDGKILVEGNHILQMADTCREFKLYLDDLHDGDESVRALRDRARIDRFSTDEDRDFEQVDL